MLKKIVFVLSFMVCVPAFSQVETTPKMLTMNDFIEADSLWSNAINKDAYQHYIEKIYDMTFADVEQDNYPYLFSEMIFYRYFASKISSMPVFNELNKKADEIIQRFISYEGDSKETFIAHKLFEGIYKFYGDNDSFPAAKTQLYKAIVELPEATAERKKLLNTISEAEAMYARFNKMLSSQTGNVTLRFSGEAYTKTMNNPSLVFVIENEPSFAVLKDALSKSDSMPDISSFDEAANLYYSFIENIKLTKTLLVRWGIPINSVLPEDLSTLLMIYDTDPFLLTCLDSSVIENANKIMSYLSTCGNLYISRINRVTNTSGK